LGDAAVFVLIAFIPAIGREHETRRLPNAFSDSAIRDWAIPFGDFTIGRFHSVICDWVIPFSDARLRD
jgi:hypothetical protein